jgi:hypothetical protein
MAGKRIPDLDPLSGAASANDDKLVIYDSSTTSTKRIDRSQLAAGLVGDLPYTPSGGISATTIPTAIAELDSEAAKSATLAASGGAALIGNTPAGTIAATTVQGAINEIVSDLAASSGSSLVGHIATGTGATARTVQSKLRDIVSVKDFGADPTGVADSAAAIQAAFDACPSGGSVVFSAGTYTVGSTLTIGQDNIVIDGQNATILAKNATNFEFVLVGTGRSNVQVRNIRINANKAGRSSGQNIRFMGAAFIDSTDCTFNNVYVENARGYSSIPGVGLAIGGVSVRCKIENCTAANCGDAGGTAADGYFTSGESNLIIGSLAVNCTDTGFVIESSNASGISGCIARSCNAGAAITNAVNDDKYGNFISGLTVLDWNSSVTGGIQIGCPVSTTTGALYDTVVSDVTVVAVAVGKGTGPAINIRKTGTPKTVRLTLNNIRIRGASTQGILVDGDQVSIRGCDISGTTAACIQFATGSVTNFVSGCTMIGGSFGIATQGTSIVTAEANLMNSQTQWGIFAFDTSTVNSMFNIVQSPGVNFFGKDVGAALNLVGAIANDLSVNNAAGSATSGSIVNKFVVTDRNGTPLGFVPVYNT